jgi:hypothetical protein
LPSSKPLTDALCQLKLREITRSWSIHWQRSLIIQTPSNAGEELPEIGPDYIAVCVVLLPLSCSLKKEDITSF